MTAPSVLVTGAGGFTGVVLRDELERAGYRVVGTTNADPGPDDRMLDIESAESCRALMASVMPDYVINLAGISFVPQSDPSRLYAANTVGAINLLDALVSVGGPVRKVILASSANVYGNLERERIAEDEDMRPASHYAASKMAMEKLAAGYFDRLPILITRPFNYTGAGQAPSFVIPKIVAHFARRAPVISLGNIDVERDFSDVAMVAAAYRSLLSSDSRSTAINICSGVGTSLADVLGMMSEIAGYRIRVEVDPKLVRPNEIRCLTGDPAKLHAAVGRPETIDLRLTLQRMYDQLRALPG